jgi:hypothetical protein
LQVGQEIDVVKYQHVKKIKVMGWSRGTVIFVGKLEDEQAVPADEEDLQKEVNQVVVQYVMDNNS